MLEVLLSKLYFVVVFFIDRVMITTVKKSDSSLPLVFLNNCFKDKSDGKPHCKYYAVNGYKVVIVHCKS